MGNHECYGVDWFNALPTGYLNQFTLPDNGMVFVLGKSGSGKSTLLNLLGGLDEFEFGEIYFEDERLSKFTKYDFYD